MRIVTIPSYTDPFVARINNVTFAYAAGATISVPDPVADIIDLINDADEKSQAESGTPGQLWTKLLTGAGWRDPKNSLPTGGTEGQFLQIDGSGSLRWATAYNLPHASDTCLGGVKRGVAVADATSETIVAQFNALLASLADCGVIKPSE